MKNVVILSLLLASMMPGANSLVVDQEFLELMKRASLLAQTAYNRPPLDVESVAGPDALYFQDEPDAALLSQENGRCFLAFRATTPNAIDWIQNINAELTTMCVDGQPERCCQVRQGFFNAYTLPSYHEDLEEAVGECMEQCGEDCELTITGTSQGSAIATIAGIALAGYNPFIITFGQPPTVLDNCADILPDNRFLRFQNSIYTEENGFQYDLVCYLRGHILDRNGQFILMGDDNKNLKLYEPHLIPTVNQINLQSLTSAEAHRLPVYMERIENLVLTDGAVGLDGFDAGVGCGQDNECNTGSCLDSICYDLMRGQPFDGNFLSLAVRAAELSRDIKTLKRPDGAQLFTDETESAMVVREGSYCYAVFGTEELSLTSGVVRSRLVDRCTPAEEEPTTEGAPTAAPTQECCPVRFGLLEPFEAATGIQQWEEALRGCKTSCPTCQTVLTGHSWAASFASIAALYVGDLDPVVMTYGRPPTLIGECENAVNVDKTYRFINSNSENNNFDVDPVPNLGGSNKDDNGISILLGQDDSYVNVYPPGENSVTTVPELNKKPHAIEGYINRLVTLRDSASGGTSIGLSGFPLGSGCNKDHECQFGQVCRASTCSLPFGVTLPPTPAPTEAPESSSAPQISGFFSSVGAGVLLSLAAFAL